MTETSDSFGSVLDAAIALYRHEIDEDEFVAAVVALPIVEQNAMPEGIRWGLNEAWMPSDGPLRQLREVLSARLISLATYDLALDAMADAGHQA